MDACRDLALKYLFSQDHVVQDINVPGEHHHWAATILVCLGTAPLLAACQQPRMPSKSGPPAPPAPAVLHPAPQVHPGPCCPSLLPCSPAAVSTITERLQRVLASPYLTTQPTKVTVPEDKGLQEAQGLPPAMPGFPMGMEHASMPAMPSSVPGG
jgi:hypothetical protein